MKWEDGQEAKNWKIVACFKVLPRNSMTETDKNYLYHIELKHTADKWPERLDATMSTRAEALTYNRYHT
jgi:hypothetical protein